MGELLYYIPLGKSKRQCDFSFKIKSSFANKEQAQLFLTGSNLRAGMFKQQTHKRIQLSLISEEGKKEKKALSVSATFLLFTLGHTLELKTSW